MLQGGFRDNGALQDSEQLTENGKAKCPGKPEMKIQCGNHLGSQMMFRKIPFIVLSLRSFGFERAKSSDLCFYKNWKDVPYHIKEIQMDDINWNRLYNIRCLCNLRTKPAALPKDGGRSAPSAPPKRKKAHKDSPAPSPQGAAEIEVPAKHRAEKSKRQEAPRETFNRFAPMAMDAEDTISSIWGDSSTPSSLRASASPMECPPSPSKSRPPPPAEKPQGPLPSPSPPYPFTPEVHVTEGVKPTKKIKGLAGQPKGGLPSNK
ncbi:hypothetical protein PoB_003255700 [Plakobranchus ocellatus]|uniref:RLR CTR domain-containing protein n=1 Tax=Plakobranchus ocellatus TaxID=259542 RepID=A0AAV4AFN3_9GAST|nr:hypothetical protein PoB_003255700 [Plakobranchus ocellatus]